MRNLPVLGVEDEYILPCRDVPSLRDRTSYGIRKTWRRTKLDNTISISIETDEVFV